METYEALIIIIQTAFLSYALLLGGLGLALFFLYIFAPKRRCKKV